MMDQIEGLQGAELPWEAGSLTVQHHQRLGIFAGSLPSVLARDPALRPNMKHLATMHKVQLQLNPSVPEPARKYVRQSSW